METSFVTNVGQRYAVADATQVGAVRREAQTLAQDAGFSEVTTGELAIIVNELASNLIKHGGGGELLLSRVLDDARVGIEVVAVDKGVGITDLARCMTDGYSTAGSLGVGMGAISRLAADFDIYSRPGAGTAVLARVWATRPKAALYAPAPPAPTRSVRAGAIALPKLGQDVSGDGWALREINGTTVVLLVDGLGYGPQAALTTATAMRFFERCTQVAPVDILNGLHVALKPTRGAVAAVAVLHPETNTLRYAGVGNIAGVMVGGDGARRHLMSYDGTLGYQLRTVRETVYDWTPGSWFAMHSDGLSPRLDPMAYPGLSQCDAVVAASVLYRDFHRTHDDATILVVNHS
ncbi:SpoIIE family protein phosphatase [Pigmentiphaga aceris]|uniref:SpoIIE family protein phosphatase n=1 Tax=Pigmentiphaga aceris TaxID=1940612 RepID=A0A5C0AUX7_9BURK|nr:ATP-binding SpoIIE family protein phosphatase [Pigmentiphaga aceris]QEI05143.1 SpoIIE family protein phosphatase [Pigmentiphaga aceris]